MTEEVVQRAVGAFIARDLDSILAVADEEIVPRALLTEAERPLYHGHDSVRDCFDNLFGLFPDWRPQPRPAPHDEDGAVVIGLDVTATAAGSGVPIDQIYWLVAWVRAGKIKFLGFFRTEKDVLDAVSSP
jgi:ketosteroid isomerase-like protein